MNRPQPALTTLLLLLTDLAVLFALNVAVVYLRLWLGGQFDLADYWRLWPVMLLFPLVYVFLGLYPGVGLSPPEELRRMVAGNSLVYIFLGFTTFFSREAEVFSRAVFLLAWLFSMVAVPVGRAILRHFAAAQPWWGVPVLVLGDGHSSVVQALHHNKGLGFKPQVLPLPPTEAQVQACAAQGVQHLVLAMPQASRQELLQALERYGRLFSHVLIVPNLFGVASLWINALDLGGVLVLEVRQNLLRPFVLQLKRSVDLLLLLLGALAYVPLMLLITVLIKLDSKGPAIYSQQRIGRGGQVFKAYKFRTMVQNADQMLERYLDSNPQYRQEWEQDQKLRNDPRVTRVGRWLRKTSLDELPQVWNVLVGQMSLVGPRPIVQSEVERYGENFAVYTQVLPGVTGLWQVSGRNDTGYAQRVLLDVYYVRNWSPWLDLYLLARTVWAVFRARGAY